jgi:DNA-binding CsgD family transcriptional regulator
LTILFITSSTLAQESELNTAYNLRFINSKLAFEQLQKIKLNAQKNNQTEIIFESDCFLTLLHLRTKNIIAASKSIQNATEKLKKISNQNTLGYYHYTMYVYKNYIEQEGYQNDITKALYYFEQSKNYKFAAISAVNIANLTDKIPKNFLDKALKYAYKSKDNDAILEANSCLSTYLKEQLNTKNIYTTDVINAYEKTIKLAENNCYNKMNVAIAYLNYANFLVIQNQNQTKIFSLIDQALSIAKKYKVVSVIRNCYGIKGLLFKSNNQLEKAEKSFLEGIDYLKKISFKEYATEQKFYQDLKEIAKAKKDFLAYHDYDLLFQEATRLANANEKETAIQNAIAKYDLKAKEEKIALLSRKNQFKDALIIASVLALLLGIGMFFYYYKSNKIKQKYFEQKKKELQFEKEQTQKELINSVLHLEKKNEILSDLKQQLLLQNKEKHATINNSIFKAIDAGLLVDNDFEKFKNNFNSIYPDFFNRLQEKANQSLTQLDLKYCGFILMKVTNKEMAMQMNVEPKSIRMARYRIKQKLQLSKDEDLDEFIQM